MSAIPEEAARLALRERLGKGARFDADAAPARELAWARRGTAYFARRLNALSDAELDGAALDSNTSRRKVVAEIGSEARTLALAVEAMRTGVSGEASAEVWAQQSALSATLPARALRTLFDHSAIHLNVEWRDLADADWDRPVAPIEGRRVVARDTAWLRARSIWVRAVDLDNGGSFQDFPADLLDALMADVIADRQARGEGPDLILAPTDRPAPVQLGKGGHSVTGTMADLVRWATGRGARRLDAPAGLSDLTD